VKGRFGLLSIVILLLLGGNLELDRLTAELRCEAGLAYLQQGLLERAESEFTSALEYWDGCTEVIFGLGRLNVLRHSYIDAEEYFLAFMEVEPDDHRGPMELSRLYIAKGMFSISLDMAQWAHDLDPSNSEIWLLMAEAATAAGDIPLAETWLIRTIEGDPALEPCARVMLAELSLSRYSDSDAREILLPATAAGYPPAWWSLARIYLSWGDNMRAVDCINTYLNLSPFGEMADSAAIILDELAETGDYIPPGSY